MRVVMRELQRFFNQPLPPASELAEKLGMHSFEVEGVEGEGEWATIEVDVLPNRGADALSHRGIAREISAILRMPMREDPLGGPEPHWEEKGDGIRLRFAQDAPCERYLGVLVEGVKNKPSPQWVCATLEAAGMRCVNAVVDATNLVMLRLGQPLHAFDADRLTRDETGAVALGVRPARKGERLVLLGGQEVELRDGMPVVVDAQADTPVALAGVKGGAQAQVDERTRRVVLEAAHFPPHLIRKTVRELGFTTDAAQRFQHNPSARLVAYAMRELITLLQELAGGEVRAVAQWYPAPEPAPAAIVVPLEAIAALSGREVKAQEARETLSWLGCKVEEIENESLRVTPPWERRDLLLVEDVVEEVVRLLGYDSLEARQLPPQEPPVADALQYASDRLRLALSRAGFTELMTYTLRPKGDVCLANALAADKRCLRTNLREGLAEALERNEPFAPLAGGTRLGVFEIGEVVVACEGDTPPWQEETHLALGVLAQGKKARQRARKWLEEAIAIVEEILGPLAWEESDDGLVREARIDEAAANLMPPGPYDVDLWNPKARYEPLVPYPVVVRDVAVWLPEGVDEAEVYKAVVRAAGDLARRVDCIDRYEREGRVSLAFRLVLQARDHTLSDEEANAIAARVAQTLRELGCEIR